MNTNPGKFQFMVFGVNNITPFRLIINGNIIPCSNQVTLPRITIDNERNFKKHINPFTTNVPLTDKPGGWFLIAKCLKNTCG